jgi:hypothetical protein
MLIQALTSIFNHSDILNCHNGTVGQIAKRVCLVSPETCLNEHSAFVADSNHAFVFNLAIFELAWVYRLYATDNSDKIDRLGFVKSFNFFHGNETESTSFYGFIIWNFRDFTLFVENEAEIIFYRSKPLICYFYSTI